MNPHKILSVETIIGFVALCSMMLAFDSPAQTTAANGVVFTTGGIGEEQQEGLRAIAGQYNLKLAFAAKGGGLIGGDVKVKVRNSKGNTVLETTAPAPCLFAKLPAGNYRVIADYQGKTQDKTIKVGSPRTPGTSLLWDAPKEPPVALSKEEKEVRLGAKILAPGQHGCW
jgi:hypothetical protein